MRLNAYLARAGVCSRRGADELIAQGRVRVNGAVAGLATTVADTDQVELDGKPLAKERLVTVLLHKPPGVVTTAKDTHGRRTVIDLVKDVGVRVVPVGRLDADTTGALLLTNDGQLANQLAHPSFEVDKVYEAFLRGIPSDDDLVQLARGVQLDDGRTAPAQVKRLTRSVIELTIHEGRNRQVKRMCEAIGHRVIKLHRSRYASLDLAGLQPGQWRRLTDDEIDRLRTGARFAGPDGKGGAAKGQVVIDRNRRPEQKRPAKPTGPRQGGWPPGTGPDAAAGPPPEPAAPPTSPRQRPRPAPRSGPSGSGTRGQRGRPGG